MRRRASAFLALLFLTAPTARAGTVLVTNLNDVAAGSLRQAVQDAAPGDTIRFAPGLTGTITNLSTPWQFFHPLTILGPGAAVLALSGADARALFIAADGEFRISGLTLRNGTGLWGSAITSSDSLTVTRCTFRANRGTNGGGAIRASGAALDVNECTFESNISNSGNGAGIQTSAYSTITGSTFRANTGSALEASATLLLINSTFFGNSNGSGGALRLLGSPEVVYDCTISGNSSVSNGGGVYAPGTIPNVGNSIIAGNTSSGVDPDFSGAVASEGYNLVGNNAGSVGFGGSGSHDQVGNPAAVINPNLAALGDYGGPTWTMPPLPGSLAIDQGKSPYLTDQRGRARAYDQPGVANAGGGDGSDIGAYELRPSVRLVTTLADAGAGSLRQAIADMHAYDADSVKFAPNVKGTITLTTGALTLAKSGVVAGPGAWALAVSGNNANRIFAVSSGKSVEISGLTVTGGKETEGIAILTSGALTLRACRVVGNNLLPGDFAFGGVIRESLGSLSMENCTVANNASGFGGAVFVGFGPPGGDLVSIANCTLSGNTGPGLVASSSAVTVRNCTIANNNSSLVGNGGGIYWLQGPAIDVGSSIVAGNAGASDVYGAFASAGWNLVGKSDGSTGFTHGVNHDLVGTVAAPLTANLGPLQANGGPGETHSLLLPSPVLDKGNAFLRPLDQRGAARYDDIFVPNTGDASDIGAYEYNPNSPVAVDPLPVAAGIALAFPHPNPAPHGLTAFVSRLGSRARVSLGIYDVAGRRVRELVSATRAAGEYADSWDGRDGNGRQAAAGVYFARLLAGPRTVTRNFVVLP